MAKDRKARKKAVKKLKLDKPITPIDLEKLGTENDPCFGKHFDLTEPECKRCGDSTICSIAYNQKTERLRAGMEKDNRFKDIELGQTKPDKKEMKKFAKAAKAKGTIGLMITKQLVNKFKITKEEAKKITKSL